jgi:hypothetical protein
LTLIYIMSAAIVALAIFGMWADSAWYGDEGRDDE